MDVISNSYDTVAYCVGYFLVSVVAYLIFPQSAKVYLGITPFSMSIEVIITAVVLAILIKNQISGNIFANFFLVFHNLHPNLF
ncbi:MAG: hypothetical protein QXN16_02390 [Candidatus Micrarchaeaceae archaeon]